MSHIKNRSVTKRAEGGNKVENVKNPCLICDFYDPDFECSCPPSEMWYACSMEPELSPEDFFEGRERDAKLAENE